MEGKLPEGRPVMKKLNDLGTSKVQVLVALLVMVLIAGGCFVAIKYVTGRYNDQSAAQNSASAEEQAKDILKKISGLAAESDVDFDFDYVTGSCMGVSERGYSIITLADERLYVYEAAFDNAEELSDDERIDIAKAKLGTKEGSIFNENMNFFGISLNEKKTGKAFVSIKVVVGEKISLVEDTVALNEYVVKRANGIEFVREQKIEEAPAEQPEIVTESKQEAPVINEPVQVTPVITNEPEQKQGTEITKEPEQKQAATVNVIENGKLNLAALKKSTADAEVEVVLICTEDKAKAGWCVGGIGIADMEVSDNEALQYKLAKAPTVGKVYTARFAVCDVLAELKAAESDEAYVLFYNGFEIQDVTLTTP